jgi:hypothetical protein
MGDDPEFFWPARHSEDGGRKETVVGLNARLQLTTGQVLSPDWNDEPVLSLIMRTESPFQIS